MRPLGKTFRKTLRAAVLLMMLLQTQASVAQRISHLSIPPNICIGDSIRITFGYDTLHNIMYQYPEVTREVDDTVFLPDGIPCGTMGCTYTSSVVFNDFVEGSTITTHEAIRYLRLNMEHSYVADIFISLTCPSGQTATIMRFGGYTTSPCASSIPDSVRTWQYGANLVGHENFGNPNIFDHGGCETYNNPFGTGWNYCWSNNTISGYDYASGDGIIYRAGHAHNFSVDSSDVEAHTNFYHPDRHFNSLVGCPLNGEWSINVIDGYTGDNGYLFGWELALDGNLVEANDCIADSFAVIGAGATRADDTSYFLSLPSTITHDTTVHYTISVFDQCGNTIDTSFSVTYRAIHHTNIHRDEIENNLPYTYNDIAFADSVTDYLFYRTDRYGCDSIVHFTLNVWRNTVNVFDTVVCRVDLPVQWMDTLFYKTDSLERHLLTANGADSTVKAYLTVIGSDTIDIHATICNGLPYTWMNGVTYYDDTQTPVFVKQTNSLCDTIFKLTLHYKEDAYVAKINAYPNPVNADNLEVTLNDISNSVSRIWTFAGRSDTARIATFTYPYTEDSVCAILFGHDAYGCNDSATIIIHNDLHVLWAPNAFTPDQQTNRTFAIATNRVQSGTVYIYTRTGNYVTSFDILTGSWDGTANGRPCPQGTYIWKARYIAEFNTRNELHSVGSITILR